jgi:O-6-methylguanine DNA methyltransferase
MGSITSFRRLQMGRTSLTAATLEDARWQKVLARDATADGEFCYAVKTTGVYWANTLAVAIPCHRVVRRDGGLPGYRWGVERKRTLLAREAGV